MTLEILRKIGLSDGEIKVYNALLDLGKSSLNNIHEKTAIERRNIYDILNKLIERGLAGYVMENKRKFFNITNPNKIFGYIEEKKHDLDEIKEQINAEMPVIFEKYNDKKLKINAQIFRGFNGVKAIYEDILDYKEHYFIGGGRYVMKNLPHFWENFNLRRIKAKIKFYNLIRSDIKDEINALQYEHIKVLPKAFDGNPNVIFIWGDKVANVLFMDELFAFVIENKEIAENYKKYFRYLWDNIAK